ncbi:NB-ARC domain-containing protein [Leuconostoc lactis]|uniref:NB-ARC domain-containing protein n=1 Tax=Leuconostoc lactis TaxID=1246 RepID=UPI0006E7336F|nr:NB-ARC domain-containing protein [Leuconostoc lactis]KQB80921.1 hypothetical protein AN225_06915 [Leuconostoc lactis]
MDTKFNLNNRILMFAICTSIEFDLRKFLSKNPSNISIPDVMFRKGVERNPKLKSTIKSNHNDDLLNELDMGDLVSLINGHKADFSINSDEAKFIDDTFKKIIPIRNRVMHTRPIQFSDNGILQEALVSLAKDIPSIDWIELNKTKVKLETNPQKLIVETHFSPDIDQSEIYNNLPAPEFDETGYIGRKKETREIIQLLESEKNQIITLIGNGGIGKTATAVNCLYELLDRNSTKYEAILWVTLKTRTLAKGEFINIKNAISELEVAYTALQKETIIQSEDRVSDILSFMQTFPTLLVIDNLETVPTPSILDFLKQIPANSKVLITSRSGLGELEYRYVLKEMNTDDARSLFTSLSIYYQLELHKQDNAQIDNLIKTKLYSSPLSIKWYVTSIYYGADQNEILSHRNDLVEFAMSNIIEKLTSNQIKILWLLLIEGKTLSYGEIDYYLSDQDTQEIILNINKLSATSMVRANKQGNYIINNMARDYLKVYRAPDEDFIKQIPGKRRYLNQTLQQLKIKTEADPFNPKSLLDNLQDENTKIASIYLLQALEMSAIKKWEVADNLLNKAADVAPNYFEVYKIKAFINAENNNLMEAIDSYRIAIENANGSLQKASVWYLYSIFYTLKVNDDIKAKECIEQADELAPNTPEIQLEKARVLMYLGEYNESKTILEQINVRDTTKFQNQYYSKFAELYRRMSRNYEQRDLQQKYSLLEQAVDKIESIDNIDITSSTVLSSILSDLLYALDYEPSKTLFARELKKHYPILQRNTSNYLNKLRSLVEQNKYMLPDEIVELGLSLGNTSIHKAKTILAPNEGVITKLDVYYGFIQNSQQSFYFKVSSVNYPSPLVGDHVKFVVKESSQGPNAISIELVS